MTPTKKAAARILLGDQQQEGERVREAERLWKLAGRGLRGEQVAAFDRALECA